jgi:integrase
VTSYDERRAERKDQEGGTIPGAANGTINRELEPLSKMLRLAHKNGQLTRLPFVEKLAEALRARFVNREQCDTVRKRLPDERRAAMTVAYTFGWRKPEVLDLKKHQYNSQDETLRLDPGTTKNGEGRVVKLTSELRAMLDAQVAWVREIERRPSA